MNAAVASRNTQYTLTVDQVQALRKMQETYRRIAEDASFRPSARLAARHQIDAIEARIRG